MNRGNCAILIESCPVKTEGVFASFFLKEPPGALYEAYCKGTRLHHLPFPGDSQGPTVMGN
jgi:hypothetical protein